MLMLIVSGLSYSLSGVIMKSSLGFTKFLPSLLVALLIGLGVMAQTLELKQTQLSITYLVIIGLEAVLALVFGMVIFGEKPSLLKGLGIALIIAGVLVLNKSEGPHNIS